jgi:YfiH family protein
MFVTNKSSYYQSTTLRSIAAIHHAYSTRTSGDLRNSKNRIPFFADIGMPPHFSYIEAEQVHGNKTARLPDTSVKRIPGVDGLIVRKRDVKNVAIGIHTADCIPLLLADTSGTVIGAVHAGWKGTLTNIASKAISEFIQLGVDPSTIVAAIGSHIGKCCYTVPEERAIQFMALYGNDARVAQYMRGIWHVDIGYVLKLQLLHMGLRADNIDECPLCTAHNTDVFFSYRKDTARTFGEMAAVIW